MMSENSQRNVENEEFEDGEERLLAKEAEDIGVKTWQAWAARDKQAREHYAAFRQKEIEKERVDRHIIHLKHLDKQEARLRGTVPTFLPKGRQKSAAQKKREARVVDPNDQSNSTPSASQSTPRQPPSLPSIPKNIDIFYTSMVFPDKKRFLIHTPNGLYMVQSVPSLPLAISSRSNASSPPSPITSPCAGGSFSTSAVVQLSPVSAQPSHNQHFPLQQQQSASANSTPMPSSPIYNQASAPVQPHFVQSSSHFYKQHHPYASPVHNQATTSAIAQPSHFYQQQAVYSTPVHSQAHANAQPAHCYQQQPAYGTSMHNQSPSVQPAPHLYHHHQQQQQQQHQSYVNPSHSQPVTSIHNQTPSASASTQPQSSFCDTSIQQHIYKESEEISLMNLPSAADECLPVLKDVSFGETSSAFDSDFNEFFVEDSHSFS